MSLSWQTAAKSIIFLRFRYNQKELALTVCENKNKPKSCCAAKCYLAKEIKKEEKRQSDSSSIHKDKTEKSELRTGFIAFVFSSDFTMREPVFKYSGILPDISPQSVFHPPNA